MSNGFIRLCSMVFCWAAISACHALLSSRMTNKDDDDDDDDYLLDDKLHIVRRVWLSRSTLIVE